MQLVRQSLRVKSQGLLTCIVSLLLALIVCGSKYILYILTSLHSNLIWVEIKFLLNHTQISVAEEA
jgi:hypothetical protein